ncbi:AAA family ATPase [Tenacibaculum aiptasiae]|uniref:AAA family ATPase n=1 Tax=Tenacibaculum aiptasiae TaxID=426481 RepID=A0A7J5AT11_9FLAO|nr:AAA family ATPase [Tenacibaculum aiptasiae]KAB1160491.1 AAA family ATPase [Tenacibaculum aiptasiae]
MSELLKAFDSYNEFEKSSYFTLMFNSIASTLSLEINLEESKENIEKVLQILNLKNGDYELVFKNWNTEDSNNADFSSDFPYQFLFKSISNKCIIWISLEYETLKIDFYYDCKDSNLEKYIINQNHKVRSELGMPKTPTFKVLTKDAGGFETEDVGTEKIELDIAKNYNSDFVTEYEKIQKAIKSKQSGLILLYGKPGTGKTTLIKGLISKNNKANFIFVQNEFVNNLLDPDFISFLLKQRNSILIIEDAEKVITSRENLKQESVVSTILQLTDGLFSDYLNIKIICTFNTSLSKIDNALLRKGRIISKYEFKDLEINKTNELLNSLNFENSNKALPLSEIYNQDEENYSNLKLKKIGF